MNLFQQSLLCRARQQFFRDCTTGMGSIALASLLNERLFAQRAVEFVVSPVGLREYA